MIMEAEFTRKRIDLPGKDSMVELSQELIGESRLATIKISAFGGSALKLSSAAASATTSIPEILARIVLRPTRKLEMGETMIT